MFCPQCGTHNDAKQSFCRQCGQPLSTVRLVLDGSADEALAKFRTGSDSVLGGLFTFGIFFAVAIVAFMIAGVWPALIDIFLGLLFSLPLVVKGTRRLQHAERLLADRSRRDVHALEPTGRRRDATVAAAASLPAAPDTDPIDATLSRPDSVADHTTFELNPTRTKH